MSKNPHFYLIFPNIFGFKGGIQVYSSFLLQALQNLHPQARYTIFLKYDKRAPRSSPFLSQTRFHCFGLWNRTCQSLLLAFAILVRGFWQQPQLLITTHINYSLVSYWLKRLAGVSYWVIVHGEEAWNLDDRDRVESLIARLHLSDCVTLTGFIPDEELCDHYNLCDVFALPSCIEGFGIVYLEALACGKPVLAGNRDGAVDPLDGGKLGVLVDPEDVGAIAERLLDILKGACPNPMVYQESEKKRGRTSRAQCSSLEESLI